MSANSEALSDKTLTSDQKQGGIKVVSILVLFLILYFFCSAIKDLAYERSNRSQEAISGVEQIWGVANPEIETAYIQIPYTEKYLESYSEVEGEKTIKKVKSVAKNHLLLIRPRTQVTQVQLNATEKWRGIFKVNIFQSEVKNRLSYQYSIDLQKLRDKSNSEVEVHFSKAILVQPIEQPKMISELPRFTYSNVGHTFKYDAPNGFTSPLNLSQKNLEDEIVIDLGLKIIGTSSIAIAPLAGSATIKLNSDWQTPSFSGAYLPITQSRSVEGVYAEWKMNDFKFSPDVFGKVESKSLSIAKMTLYDGVDRYQMFHRAVKYWSLIVLVSFTSLFFTERLRGVWISPIHYGMVGAANVVFFLLMLAFSEHLNFATAYFISVFSSSVLVSLYCKSVLDSRVVAWVSFALSMFQYVVIYFLLKENDYALVGGAVVSYLSLAVCMWFTRKWGVTVNKPTQVEVQN